jgi:hypothetical protein
MVKTPFPEKYMHIFRRVAGRAVEAQTEAE